MPPDGTNDGDRYATGSSRGPEPRFLNFEKTARISKYVGGVRDKSLTPLAQQVLIIRPIRLS